MIGGNGYTGSLGYIIPLCILTGLIMLRIDVKGYVKSAMAKERKITQVLGWINISLGIGLFIGRWVFSMWSH